MNKHKHFDCILAWAEGKDIEVKVKCSNHWIPAHTPAWYLDQEYRIKPEPKPDIVKESYMKLDHDGDAACWWYAESKNVRYTFDGETGKLKAVELIQ